MISTRIATVLLLCPILCAQSPPQRKPSTPKSTTKPSPDESAQLYRNTAFGFRFQIPYGWVDRTKEMRDQDSTQTPPPGAEKLESTSKPAKQNPAPQNELLLAVFERPPQAIGDSVNSAVVIATESVAAYPGLKKAEDYIAPLTELTASQGFKVEGEPDLAEIDARQLIRLDFSKPITDKLTMHQSTLILLAKSQIVSFTFIAGSEDEIDDLIEGLHFVRGTTSSH